jgi:hypothetical protein
MAACVLCVVVHIWYCYCCCEALDLGLLFALLRKSPVCRVEAFLVLQAGWHAEHKPTVSSEQEQQLLLRTATANPLTVN